MRRITVFLLVFAVLASAFAVNAATKDIVRYGDVSCDGNVNLGDASAMLQHIAGWDTPVWEDAADVNLDDEVTLADVSILLKRLAGWPVALGPRREIPNHGGSHEFPDANFEEDEFCILHYGSNAAEYTTDYITADGREGDVIGEAVAARNREAQEKYNVKIVAEESGSPAHRAKIAEQAGQCDFDLINEYGTASVALALWGMLYDYNDLDSYMNLDRDYWFPDAAEELTVDGKLFLMPSAVSMDALAYAELLCFNKDMMDKLGFAWPYDYVYADCWTYDAMLTMAAAAEKDAAGGVSGDVILAGVCRDDLTKANPDGTYDFIPYTERVVEMYNKFVARAKKLTVPEGDDVTAFLEGKTLFLHGCLEDTKALADMRDDYGIVPMPTAVEGEDFASEYDYCAPMSSIPLQVHDPEMTATVLDYLAYESAGYIEPALMETTLKTKRMEDTRDYEMFEIIRDGLDFSWEKLYLHDSTVTGIRGMMLETGDFVTLKRYGAKCQSEIDGVLEKLAAIER